MCAHGREGQTHIGFVPRHSLKNFVWRGSTLMSWYFRRRRHRIPSYHQTRRGSASGRREDGGMNNAK